MSAFYYREENPKEIKIIFRYYAVHTYTMLVLFIIMLFYYLFLKKILFESSPFIQISFILFLFFICIPSIINKIGSRKATKEAQQALRAGKYVKKISGSRWSFKNSWTISIPK